MISAKTLLPLFLTVSLLVSPVAAAEKSPAPEVISLEHGFYYEVKKGDTLWDISHKFFDSPWYWPGLWNENGEIQNPHWIYPGQKLRLYRKAGNETIAIPREEPEIPETASESVAPPVPEKPAPVYTFTSINRVGFIAPVPTTPSATIIDSVEGKAMISVGDRVYLRPEGNRPLPLGGRFAVYRIPYEVMDPDDDRKEVGFQHDFSGIIEITEIRPEVTIGVVISGFRSIRVEDLLTPQPLRTKEITLQPSVAGLRGKILKGDRDQLLFGGGDLVFVNVGLADGVMPGQIYHLLEEKEVRFKDRKKDPIHHEIPYGAIVIIDSQETASAAIIIASEKAAKPGTLFESPNP